jgi:hypothetical protein
MPPERRFHTYRPRYQQLDQGGGQEQRWSDRLSRVYRNHEGKFGDEDTYNNLGRLI